MKDSIFNRMICVVLVLFYTLTIVPASTWKELGQSAKSTMDTYLDKADLARSQSEWDMYVQTGFALVVLSAALKAVPEDMIEAARIDGAGEFRILMQIVIPNIRASIISVSTTILLAALKCFDIVYSMTNGLFGTEVLASQQYKQMFTFHNYGRGSAIAILILIGVSPVIYYNLKEFKNREAFK